MIDNYPFLPGDKFKSISGYSSDYGVSDIIGSEDILFCTSIVLKSALCDEVRYSFINTRTGKCFDYYLTSLLNDIVTDNLMYIPRSWCGSITNSMFCKSWCPLSKVCNITDCPINNNSPGTSKFYLPGDKVVVRLEDEVKETIVTRVGIVPIITELNLIGISGNINISARLRSLFNRTDFRVDDFYYSFKKFPGSLWLDDVQLSNKEVSINLSERKSYSIIPSNICNCCIMSNCEGCKIKEML